MRNVITIAAVTLFCFCLQPAYSQAQYYADEYPQGYYAPQAGEGQQYQQAQQYQQGQQGYDETAWRHAGRNPSAGGQRQNWSQERILREQVNRTMSNAQNQGQVQQQQVPANQAQMYDTPYGHRIDDEDQVRQVMAEARYVVAMIKKSNGKPFIVIDKRNFQFYLYNSRGKLLRIGPVAIGKGTTQHGRFETPVGIYPIKSKIPVDDWVRPDWYFVEEGEAIPKRWEDRKVPGFFRFKMVIDGTRYIHYAEATGGRLTHGCLGLDWEDAEAVFHTLQVGSYCIVIDRPFLTRLARGEFPIHRPKSESDDKPSAPNDKEKASRTITARADSEPQQSGARVFGSMW